MQDWMGETGRVSRRHALQVEGGVERAHRGRVPLTNHDGDAAVVEG